MNRHHTVSDAFDALERIKASYPRIESFTQIMVGFPSETDNDFRDTLNYIKRSVFDGVIVFPYHEKENTPAAGIEGKVPEKVVQARLMETKAFLKKCGIRSFLNCQI